MSQFTMENLDEGDIATDSDHRRKRRKMGVNSNINIGATVPSGNPSSVAARMMANMGYVKGQGLGSKGSGILAPIETQMRPQGAGLGAVREKTKQAKEEEKREAARRGETLEDSEAEEQERRRKVKERKSNGIKAGTSITNGRPKVNYRTAAELEATAEGLVFPAVLKTIIDATGPETKLLTSTAGLMTKQTSMVPAETEAIKNARRARIDIDAYVDEWQSLAERKKYYEMQEAQLVQEYDNENEILLNMESLMESIEELLGFQKGVSDSNYEASWDEIIIKLENAEAQLKQGLDPSILQEITVAAIHPLLKISMENWDPLEDRTGVSSYIERQRKIFFLQLDRDDALALQSEISSTKAPNESTPYESMILLTWFPKVQSTLTNDWDVLDPSPVMNLLEVWRPLLPSFIVSKLVNQIVFGRLTKALSSWKPRPSSKHQSHHSQPPHIWLFPWLPFLDGQYTDAKAPDGLLALVKRKLKSVLANWDLTGGILPDADSWRSELSSEFSALLTRHLLPRLAAHLSSKLVIDRADQDLTPLTQVLQWAPVFSSNNVIAQLLVAELFPKWHYVLYLWLTAEPNYDEIREWYQRWKDRLHDAIPHINDHASIAAEWTNALETINLALSLGPDAASQLPPPQAGPVRPPPAAAAAKTSAIPSIPHNQAETTFRDVVEDWCAEENLLLIPLREADARTGLPLFRLTASASGKGGVKVFLKGDVVWARAGQAAAGGWGEGGFMPVGLDRELVARAERK